MPCNEGKGENKIIPCQKVSDHQYYKITHSKATLEVIQVTCIVVHNDNMFWKINKPNETKLDIHIGFCPLYLVSSLMYTYIIPKIWGLVFKARVLAFMAKRSYEPYWL
jgi:hypothetical protein